MISGSGDPGEMAPAILGAELHGQKRNLDVWVQVRYDEAKPPPPPHSQAS